jgi:hypothetical protein
MMGFAKGSTHPTGLICPMGCSRPMTGSAKQSILSLRGEMDCFAALAMTAPARIRATRWLTMTMSWLFDVLAA